MTGIVFFAVALLLTLIALGAVLWPLLRGPRAAGTRQASAVVALFRDQLRELDSERGAGTIDEAQYQQSRRDIERNLLDAVAGAATPPSGPRRATLTAALAGVFLLVTPIALYTVLGTPDALIPGTTGEGAPAAGGGEAAAARAKAQPLTNEQVQKMIASMEEALKKSPGDAQGWAMLARAYSYQRQYQDAVRAYTKAIALTPRDARLLADLADAMAMLNDRRLDGEPLKLLQRALQIDPKDIKTLALLGTAAFDHQEYAKAVSYWEAALKANPNDAEFARALKSSLDEARQLAAGGKPGAAAPGVASANDGGASSANDAGTAAGVSGANDGGAAAGAASANNGAAAARPQAVAGATVRGKVSLAAALAAKAAPGDTVFVFARAAQGPRVPLALVRRQVKDLPFEFSLDDSMAMMPDFTLSKYAPVIVGARISHSGDAIAAPGDLQGFSKPVKIGASGISVTIDQVVQ